ncbi:MAG: hypothetical protein DNFNHJIP_00201 [Candidatus Argoarchaeum ethanivorans]|uniref:Uncharacterized protein n=1 Tax=Candidatus Argoarchaeum ethanivorans TaxID=2608793 RepID=A0A812A084_9EURY|nr:MAG: hypothetical protein DNFNHJIP_00201 [Candidatus Argoarchaeum ethanivorans]
MRVCESLIEGGISEVYFRYTTKLEGYANLSLDIPKLYAIEGQRLPSLEKRANLYQNSEQIYKLNKKRDCHE